MKSYTDLEQSKKLAEFLPLESADMRYGYIAPYEFSDRMYEGGYDNVPYPKDFLEKNPNFSENDYDDSLPCWSLAALLSVLPVMIDYKGSIIRLRMDKGNVGQDDYAIWYDDLDNGLSTNIASEAKNFIDAAYEMILKLHEQKLL